MDKARQIKTERNKLTPKEIARLGAGGFASGVVNGIFGTGAGVLVVFLLAGVAGHLIRDKRRIFANVTAMVLPIASTSALVYSRLVPPSPADVVAVASASLAGGLLGALALGKINLSALKALFALLMIISGVIMLVGVGK